MKTIFHISLLPLWDLGKGKGRVSTYLPIKGLADAGYRNIYITNSNRAENDAGGCLSLRRIYTLSSGEARPLVQLLLLPLTNFIFIINCINIARKAKPSVVYSHSATLAFAGYAVAKIYKAKYVLRLYGVGNAGASLRPRDILLWQAFWFRADKYILTDDGTRADEVAIKHGVAKEKILFLRNGIKKDFISVGFESLRKKLAPNGETLLLSISRLVAWKNVDKIIEAMPEVIAHSRSVRLIVVGDGPDKDEYMRLASSLGVKDNVLFVGAVKQSEVYLYNFASDIFISMNNLSSISNPVFEAMSCGACVIALDRGTTRELIRDGENGIVISDPSLLAEAIIGLLKNPHLVYKYGAAAKKTMDSWPSWDERVDTEVNGINQLCRE